jgi:hypothetical protein
MVSCRPVPKNYSKDDIPAAQTTPPDMVFVVGDGSLPSFYMGVSEECNINYQIYRNWQKLVYVDEPEVYSQSEPQNRDVSNLLQFNDPYYSYYQNHEAFAYYPIVGVSWVQAMDYLQWKGDRLNEKILFEVGITDEADIVQQINEQNFTTEAYLCNQYEGLTKREIIDTDLGGTTRKVRYDDGMLFCTPRLPTEAEWEYVLATCPAKPINPKTYANPFSKEAMFPFGRDYYPFIFGRKQGLEFYKHLEQGFPYHVKYDSIPTVPDRLTGAGDYNLASPGIANLEGNVPEWLMDEYTDKSQQEKSSIEAHWNNFPVLEPKYYTDVYGFMLEKDSLGKLPFAYFLPDKKGQPVKTRRYGYTFRENLRVDTIYRNPTDPNFIISRFYNYSYTLDSIIGYLDNSRTIPFYDIVYKHINGKYYSLRVNYDLVKLDTGTHYRVVKGGTWKQPDGHKREKMLENEGSPNVGFRAVITYTGIPLFDKKYKVVWK